jgi:formate/nitrite transporter FocA (FNT family)
MVYVGNLVGAIVSMFTAPVGKPYAVGGGKAGPNALNIENSICHLDVVQLNNLPPVTLGNIIGGAGW